MDNTSPQKTSNLKHSARFSPDKIKNAIDDGAQLQLSQPPAGKFVAAVLLFQNRRKGIARSTVSV